MLCNDTVSKALFSGLTALFLGTKQPYRSRSNTMRETLGHLVVTWDFLHRFLCTRHRINSVRVQLPQSTSRLHIRDRISLDCNLLQHDVCCWAVRAIHGNFLHLLEGLNTPDHMPKDRVLAIQRRVRRICDKELATCTNIRGFIFTADPYSA